MHRVSLASLTGKLPGDAESTRQIRELHKALVVKTQTAALSNVRTEICQKRKATFGLQLQLASQPPFAASSKSIDAFNWNDVAEANPDQAERSEYFLPM